MVPFMLDADILRDEFEKLLSIYQPGYCYIPKSRERVSLSCYRCIRQDIAYCLYENEEGIVYDIHFELALLLPTSGTTGGPKAVRQLYKNIKSNATDICKYLNISEVDRAILALPLHYTYGLSILHSHFLAGGTLLLTKQNVLQKVFWDFFRVNSGTSLSGVPYTYELLRKVEFAEMDLPSLRYMTQAGGALGEQEWDYMQKYSKQTNVAFYIMYGQTEATARIAYLPYESLRKKRGSVGIAIPGSQISIEEGEVVCSGDNVCLGYAMSFADLKKGDEWGGVLHTGDMGYLDEEGYLYVRGRKDRCIKILGKRVNLDDLQILISRNVGAELYVVSNNDIIEFVSQDTVDKDDVIAYLRKLKIPTNHVRVRMVDRIPRKSMGKVDYGKL